MPCGESIGARTAQPARTLSAGELWYGMHMPNAGTLSTLNRYVYGLTIFVGSYLLFQIQPLVGKVVTARFGGAAGIWCVCVLFFQLALLLGYTLTYLLSKLAVRWQCIIYGALMVLSLFILNVPPQSGWTPDSTQDPVRNLLMLMTMHLAVPCLLLSSVSGMLQNWFAIAKLGDPYPLYSLSNIGSLGALLAYPFLIEPALTVSRSLHVWTIGYGLLVFLAGLAAILMLRQTASNGETALDDDATAATDTAAPSLGDVSRQTAAKPSSQDIAWWIGLSALSSVILLAYTTYITQDIAPVPLLWILPLCLYLLSFILCFGSKSWYSRRLFLFGGPILWLLDPFCHDHLGLDLVCVLLMIFFFSMSCNGEIVRRKPDPVHLPLFYLMIAVGGAIGGIFVNILAPQIFDFYAERMLVITCMVALCLYVSLKEGVVLFGNRWVDNIYLIAMSYACLVLAGYKLYSTFHGSIDRARNLYGCISVAPRDDNSLALASGTIIHGSQFKDAARKREPTQYFTRASAIGLIDQTYREEHPGSGIKYGIVGLGAGTIAAYGAEGDTMTFYELDPKVLRIAKKYFTFLSDSPASVNVLIGDARITMEQQSPQQYDILVIDAFNGDAIPIHLLTRQSMQMYLSHLKPDGILLMHVSNRYLDLLPVIGNLAQEFNLKAFSIQNDRTKYVALSRDPHFKPAIKPDRASFYARLRIKEAPVKTAAGLWTDDYSNLPSVLMPHGLADD